MDKTVVDALRRATSLTRAGKAMQATEVIRAALLGRSGSTPPEADTGTRAPSVASAKVLDLTATRVDREPSSAGPTPQAAPPQPDSGVRRSAFNARRPLADTIRDLAAVHRVIGAQQARRAGPPDIPDGARYLSRTFQSPSGSRDYRLYIPAAAAARPTGLVMMLHGCKQDPDDFATGTGMNRQADATGMIVVYPAQPATANPSLCWNWFNAADQRRGAGEASLLADLARSVTDEYGVPADAIFVAGLSAGGAMAAILAEAYPDVFSAAGIHSGLPAGAAMDMPSAWAAMAGQGSRTARPPAADTRLIVFHGTADTIVRPVNGEALSATARQRAAATLREEGRTGAGRGYLRITYQAADGGTLAEHWIMEDHGHAWSGGHPAGSYTDPDGPDASGEMMRFFVETASGRRRD